MSEDSGIRELAGRYRLITPLGRRVMRGWDLHLRQVVAIRLFAAQEDPDQFVERAAALTGLDHPGLVQVLDAGVSGDEPFMVQEFIAATTLRSRLAEGPLSANEVTELGSALGRALAYAHSQGVAHRDIQPRNILLGPGQEPYLTDVGISATSAPSYMSPEQANGQEPSTASDVYALGLVLLEALTGRTEYPGDDATTALARLNRAPLISPDLPHAATLLAMTSANPDDRPDAATCVDMLRGSSAKSRVQTRTVLVAAVAAAIVATGITVVLNIPKQSQPQVEPRDARLDQPRSTNSVQVTSRPATEVTPNIIEVPAASGQPVQQRQQPPRTSATSTPTGQPPAQGDYVNVPVALVPPPTETTVVLEWLPWYLDPVNWPKPHKKPKKPKPTATSTPATTTPPPAAAEEGDEND
ncbi:serine/threonine protein kinase [Kibdelosporangium banguiense]|uniref:non-specific serine/threonine protein kinase n=1 Tax=Kibdelosporangium banguiense TaxID=1365924 RepID=A0ABS4U098_9PSEU|nr:serine/threonine-protein kinase [Kibdelosporangium banguiense]MBP2330072.1 serine/threonine protein kinase [Kibdelosporangium banguiense]